MDPKFIESPLTFPIEYVMCLCVCLNFYNETITFFNEKITYEISKCLGIFFQESESEN